jgi:predicted nucleotidyltransferase component of viral defense system
MADGKYQTPAPFRMAIESRLRSEVARTGMDSQRLRQLLAFDRFMARLFATFHEEILLKGGLALELRLSRARATKDIDVRMVGAPESTLSRLQEAGRMNLGDFLRYEVAPDLDQPDLNAAGMRYTGHRYRCETYLAGKRFSRPFGLDVAFAEPLVGQPEVIQGTDFFAFAGFEPTEYRVYPPETHIAEKLHAYTLPRSRPNSRVKDLPDLALLALVRKFDSKLLRDSIRQTFAHRETHPVPPVLPLPPQEWGPVYERMAAIDELQWKDLDVLTTAVQEFLDPVFAGNEGLWNSKGWSWS